MRLENGHADYFPFTNDTSCSSFAITAFPFQNLLYCVDSISVSSMYFILLKGLSFWRLRVFHWICFLFQFFCISSLSFGRLSSLRRWPDGRSYFFLENLRSDAQKFRPGLNSRTQTFQSSTFPQPFNIYPDQLCRTLEEMTFTNLLDRWKMISICQSRPFRLFAMGFDYFKWLGLLNPF
jgi:hypothetical protein